MSDHWPLGRLLEGRLKVSMGQLSCNYSRDPDTTRQASQILSFRSEIRHLYVAHHNLIFKQQKKWRCNNGVVYRSQKQSNEDHRPMAAGLDRIRGHLNANLVRRADLASIAGLFNALY